MTPHPTTYDYTALDRLFTLYKSPEELSHTLDQSIYWLQYSLLKESDGVDVVIPLCLTLSEMRDTLRKLSVQHDGNH